MMEKNNSQKGQIFVMALLISASISAIALGMSSIILSGARQAADVGQYVPAFYAADAGVERALFRLRQYSNTANFNDGVFLNGTFYGVIVNTPGAGDCPTDILTYCIFSTGNSSALSRRIQVSY